MLCRASPLSANEFFQTPKIVSSSAAVTGRRKARVANERMMSHADVAGSFWRGDSMKMLRCVAGGHDS